MSYASAMNWVEIIDEELPRLRLYASAVLGGPAAGDLTVEAALGALFEHHLALPVDRTVLFRLLDCEVRPGARFSEDERAELLKHIAGFTADDAADILHPDDISPLQSAC